MTIGRDMPPPYQPPPQTSQEEGWLPVKPTPGSIAATHDMLAEVLALLARNPELAPLDRAVLGIARQIAAELQAGKRHMQIELTSDQGRCLRDAAARAGVQP